MEYSLLDICDIDCKNLNLVELQQILTENELKKIKDSCSNPITNNVVKSEIDSDSILEQLNELLKSEPEISQPIQPTPIQPTQPITQTLQGPKLLTAPLTTRINRVPLKPSSSLKSFAISMTGGSSLIGINISIDKITKLLNVSDQQSEIMTYYYNNDIETINNESIPKVLNMDELILIEAALKYYDFIEKKYESIFDVISSDAINSIPQEFRYNFYDIVKRDKNISSEQIDEFNIKVNNIKKLMYNLKMRNQNNITFELLNKYMINVSKPVSYTHLTLPTIYSV